MQLNSGPSPIEPEEERDLFCLYMATNICLIKQSFHKEKPNKNRKAVYYTLISTFSG